MLENDDVSYSLKNVLEIHKQTDIPIVFDSFHTEVGNMLGCFENGRQPRQQGQPSGPVLPPADYIFVVLPHVIPGQVLIKSCHYFLVSGVGFRANSKAGC